MELFIFFSIRGLFKIGVGLLSKTILLINQPLTIKSLFSLFTIKIGFFNSLKTPSIK